jgi:hypothetical protein
VLALASPAQVMHLSGRDHGDEIGMDPLHSEPHPADMWHPKPGPHPVHTIHRVGAAVCGGFLTLFGGLGLGHGLPFFSTTGSVVLGLSSNGLLAVLSVIVGTVLLGSAIRGGHTASTISMTLGVLFLLSGLGNSLVLATPLNVFAFRPTNVVFSLAVGAVLLVTGAYGRVTGGLPLDNPYHRDKPDDHPSPAQEQISPQPGNRAAARELAEAERAYALHWADDEQIRRLEIVHQYRFTEHRLRAWRESAQRAPGQRA